MSIAGASAIAVRNVALGGFVGLLIGLIIVFCRERIQRRIRDVSELEAAYAVPILVSVPQHAEYAVTEALCQERRRSRPSLYDEVFQMLCSYVRHFAGDRDVRTILVVSASPGDGKTTVSCNLAKAAAAAGSRVLLVEGDLRRGTLASALTGRAGPGLADVLTGAAPMEHAIRSLDVGKQGMLDILVASEITAPNAAALMQREEVGLILERARAVYDLVVIDTPPLSMVADAVPLMRQVDGVLVVARIGTRRRHILQALRDQLHNVDAPVLGLVANAVGVTPLLRTDETASV